ncbi:MAG: hypothetical protein AB8G05_27655 [Oligoflexales bacterium]
MKLLLVLANFLFFFIVACSEQNFSSISKPSRAEAPIIDTNEDQQKIESTDIGNGFQEPQEPISSDKFFLACLSTEVDRHACKLGVNDFVDGEIKDISWSVSNDAGKCTLNDLGYPNGTNLSISFTSSQECSEWKVNVSVTLANEQTGTLTFDSTEKKSPDMAGNNPAEGQDSGNANESNPISQNMPETELETSEEVVEVIPLASLLMDVEGGINGGHFDVDAYSCEEEASGGKGKKGGDCLIEHVHEYDIEADRNGIDLLNPRISSDDIGIDTDEDFCILALNTEYSQEAVIKLNNRIFKASSLPAVWDASCEKYNLEGDNGLPELTAFELSFPVEVISIPNGIKLSNPGAAQGDENRGGTLLIRIVKANTGELIKELSVYHHQ